MTHISLRRLLPALALVVAALASAPASAGPYSSFVVFGDSLSDNGNNAAAGLYDPSQVITGNTYVPSNTYLPGTYSNGPVWASDFAAMIGLPLAPSLARRHRLRVRRRDDRNAGPRSGRLSVQPARPVEPVPHGDRQPCLARRRSTSSPAAATTRVLRSPRSAAARASRGRSWRRPPRSPPTSARSSTRCRPPAPSTSSSGMRRTSASRRQSSPRGAATAGLATILTASMNSALAARLAGEAGVTTFDIFGLGTQIAANPALFGFTNVSDACGAVAGANCSQYAYWDGIHPTAALHRVVADAFAVTRRCPSRRRGRCSPAAWRRSARSRVGASAPAAAA